MYACGTQRTSATFGAEPIWRDAERVTFIAPTQWLCLDTSTNSVKQVLVKGDGRGQPIDCFRQIGKRYDTAAADSGSHARKPSSRANFDNLRCGTALMMA